MSDLLCKETKQFDEKHFYCNYEPLSWKDQTLRHIGQHIAKAGSKLVEFEEGSRSVEVIVEQVIPDLALYRTQIINLLEFKPDEIDWDAHRDDKENVEKNILWAVGMIGRYIEPREHAVEARHEQLTTDDLKEVPVRLHFAATALAKAHGIDLTEAHRARMQR